MASPPDLIPVDRLGHKLARRAAWGLEAMRESALKAGFGIKLNSAARDPERQAVLYKAYQEALELHELGKGPMPSPVAAPGTSEHEKGIAVDIEQASVPGLGKWLCKNAASFGFYATAANELWHWAFYEEGPPAHLLARHEANIKKFGGLTNG